jgi:hypothetical protein
MTRVRYVLIAVSAVLGASATLMGACSSSSTPGVDAGLDANKRDNVVPSDMLAPDAADRFVHDVAQDTTDGGMCNPDGSVGQGPTPADSSSCVAISGNCLGVGAPCDPSNFDMSQCSVSLAAFPTSFVNCEPIVNGASQAYGVPSDSGFCAPEWAPLPPPSQGPCIQGCGPGATCCYDEAFTVSYCLTTACVASGFIDGGWLVGYKCDNM